MDAFRGHGFSLLVTSFLRGLQLMLFPQKSPPALRSTIDGKHRVQVGINLEQANHVLAISYVKSSSWLLLTSLIVVEGGDSSGKSETVETHRKRSDRGGSASPAERVRMERKSTAWLNQSFSPKYLKQWIYETDTFLFLRNAQSARKKQRIAMIRCEFKNYSTEMIYG